MWVEKIAQKSKHKMLKETKLNNKNRVNNIKKWMKKMIKFLFKKIAIMTNESI